MFKIGAKVYTTDGEAGKLMKVVIDPDTERVTHLIVERGFLQKIDRVVPFEAVDNVTDEGIRLKVSTAELEQFPRYRGSHFISEGMLVYDRADQVVGTVQLVYAGGASDAAIERALGTTEVAADNASRELWERMMRQGYIRIEGPEITGIKRYVTPEQIANVVANRVRLYASRDELIRRVEREKALSLTGRITKGMPVYDRADQLIGKVKLVYYGGACDCAIERASLLTEEAAAAVGVVAKKETPVTFGSDEVAPEARERMLRQGYIRIEGLGITGLKRYVMPEQIESVTGYRVRLHASRDELITPGT
jgi:ribosomal 30S subunit maturation factor RimM